MKKEVKIVLLVFVLVIFLNGVYHGFLKPLPEGLSYEGQVRNVPAENIEFLKDLTYNCHEGSFGECD